MSKFIRVVAVERFVYQGQTYQAGVLYDLEKETAKRLATDGRVKLYTGSGSVFNNSVRKAQRPEYVINIKPIRDTAILR